MRVAVVAEYYPRRRDPASGIWAHRQALAARDAGADVRVFVLERVVPPKAALRGQVRASLRQLAAQPRREVIDGIEVEYVRYVSPPRWRSYASWHLYARPFVQRALNRAGPFDLIHAHYALPGGGTVAHRDEPLVVSVHGGEIFGSPMQVPRGGRRVRRVLRRADVVMCNSARMLERSARLARSDANMRVVHLGATAPSPLPPKHETPTVVTLANVEYRKRHEIVLKAIESLPDVRWVVIGDGPTLPALREAANDRVEFRGAMPPDAAIEELARGHVMALPSIAEAFGVAYVEALACGVPAIGCEEEGGPEEIAALGGGMLLVPREDPAAVAAAIERAISDPSLPAAARANAEQNFSWEACGRATVAAYEDALR